MPASGRSSSSSRRRSERRWQGHGVKTVASAVVCRLTSFVCRSRTFHSTQQPPPKRQRRHPSPSTRVFPHNDAAPSAAREAGGIFNNFHILSNHPQSVDCRIYVYIKKRENPAGRARRHGERVQKSEESLREMGKVGGKVGKSRQSERRRCRLCSSAPLLLFAITLAKGVNRFVVILNWARDRGFYSAPLWISSENMDYFNRIIEIVIYLMKWDENLGISSSQMARKTDNTSVVI